MAASINEQDPRYNALKRGHNLRFPLNSADQVQTIEVCESASDVVSVLQRVVNSGQRPTIRSGGHCYEDFSVNNPHGALLDLGTLTVSHLPDDGSRYRISAGRPLGDVYLELFKLYGVTIPAGSCCSVGSGGHISGGGYGLLSRRDGLTVDWVTAVDIATVDKDGRVQMRRVDKSHDPELLRACRGAGGGNFGVVTGFLFDKLPQAPREVISGGVSFEWATMSEGRFVDIVMKFGDYWQTRGKDPDTWGLFSILGMSHSSNSHFGLSLQFCNPDGTCRDLSVVNEFLERFEDCNPSAAHSTIHGDRIVAQNSAAAPCPGPHALTRRLWLDATINSWGGGGSRAKYKSAYMAENFTASEAKCIYKHLRRTIKGVSLRQGSLAADSYGGAVNRPAMVAETSIAQRSSIMKLQFQTYWQDSNEDAGHLEWMNDFYTDLYSGENVPSPYAGTPYPGNHYQGCYINYPDNDMLRYIFWPQLYYGDGDLYPFLQDVKRRYDPHNVFHHAMSIRPKMEKV